jgi:acyl-coenzyme A synthetase/AMP-(fatty) acid ligase
VRILTYRELRDEVATFAGALRGLGVEKGDRVVIYMPMIPQALVAMLACARLGAVHSVVFGGFAPRELASRINDARPRVIVSASCGVEPNRLVRYKSMLDSAIEESPHKPDRCVIFQRPEAQAVLVPGRDVDWNDAVAGAATAECVPVNATDPLYILYTSGTTGRPKGSVRDNGGHAVALKWTMKNFYDVEPGEVFWSASDVGWVVGHSYIVYAPLLQYVMCRTDDIINVAGHRLSTGEMEGVVASHPDVAECAVIGMADQLKGQVPLGFLVLKAGVDRPHDHIVKGVVQMVREQIGPVADFKRAVVVERLPKTRSGKVLRSTMQKIADHQDYKVPATIEDASVLFEIAEVLTEAIPAAGASRA